MTAPMFLSSVETPARTARRGRIDLWSFALDRDDVDRSVLSVDERIRAARFKFEEHRAAYVVGRSWLREVIGTYAGAAPAALRFRYLEFGKPVLDGPDPPAFSLAHSENLAVIGIGHDGPVGVDVERIRPHVLDRAAAALVLSTEELKLIDRHPDPDRAFLRCWVRKEAFAKATGIGLERDLAELTLTAPHGTVDWDGLRIRDVRIDDASICAVAAPVGSVVRYGGVWRPPTRNGEP